VKKYFLCFLFFIFSLCLFALEEIPFPLALILETIEVHNDGNNTVWQPNWPFEIPPDAFYGSEFSSIVLEAENYSLRYSKYPDGKVRDFPLKIDDKIINSQLVYNHAGEIEILSLEINGEDFWTIEVLERIGNYPSMLRLNDEESWYFINMHRGRNEITESWYDEEGFALGAFIYSLIEIGINSRIRSIAQHFSPYTMPREHREHHYNSQGLISAVSDYSGIYFALYNSNNLVRHWERVLFFEGEEGFGNYSFQYEAMNMLLRKSGEDLDYRYEYVFDDRGSWIERQEIRMLYQNALFFPSSGTYFRRILEYREEN